jgi:heparin binding hemagglutinin HbhA
MAVNTESPRSGRPGIDPTPLFAVVGATDLAVERVRAAAANATAVQAQLSAVQAQFEARVSAVQKRVSEFDPKTLRDQAQEAPLRAAGRALEVAGKAEAAYEEFARRGKELVERVRSQAGTQDFVAQAGSTLSRGRAAVTVARRAADDTAVAILGTLNVGRTETATAVEDTMAAADVAAKKTRTSARKTVTTARKDVTATKSAAKGARTSATRTAKKAGPAARATAKKIGN